MCPWGPGTGLRWCPEFSGHLSAKPEFRLWWLAAAGAGVLDRELKPYLAFDLERLASKIGLVERRALLVADRPKSGDVETVGQHTPDGPPKYGTIPHL